MKMMAVLVILLFNLLDGISDPYHTFLRFINESGSIKMSLDFYQTQYGEYFETSGSFYYLRDQYYFFDHPSQRLIFKDGEITTINKNNRQIIIDNIVPGEVTIFNILSGEKEFILTQDATMENGYSKIPFNIPSWDLKGLLRVVPGSGIPLEVILFSGDQNEKRIKINLVEPCDTIAIPKIDVTNFEKIDLRE